MSEIRLDAGRLGKIERTPQGGIRVPAALTRTGVLEYRNPDGTTRRELRHPDEVFRADSLDTLRSAPVTDGHRGWVTPENWKEFSLGHVAEGSVRKDSRLVSSDLVIQDAETLKRVDSGDLAEVSLGYRLDYDPTPGTFEGQHFDGQQRNIRYNHVALLPKGGGRAGREVGLRFDAADLIGVCDEFAPPPSNESQTMKIRFDGRDYDLANSTEVLALQATLDKARTDAADAKSALDKLQGRFDQTDVDLQKAKADLADKTRFDAAVSARVSLEGAARTILGDTFSPSGKSDREVMIAVVRSDSKEFKDEGKSDDYVRSRFDAVCEKGLRADSVSKVPAIVQALKAESESTRDDADPGFTVEQIRANSINTVRNAWNTVKA
jgi:hypothetical protein